MPRYEDASHGKRWKFLDRLFFPGKRSNKNIQSFRQTMWFKLGLHDLLIIIPLALKTDRTLSPFSFLSLFLNKMCRYQHHNNQSKSFTNQWIVVVYNHCHETRRPKKGFMPNSVVNQLNQTQLIWQVFIIINMDVWVSLLAYRLIL